MGLLLWKERGGTSKKLTTEFPWGQPISLPGVYAPGNRKPGFPPKPVPGCSWQHHM